LLLSRWRISGHGRNPLDPVARLILQWLLPVAGTMLFLLLFTFANPLLSYWFQLAETAVVKFLNAWSVPPFRLIMWGMVASLLWAMTRIRYRRRNFPEIGNGQTLSPSLLTRCLILFNLIFALQTTLDLLYLWGGAKLPAGMTYAQYAHRGAYPLIVTALLAGGFVLATFRAGARGDQTPIVRGLVFFWLAQNILLIVNSLWRLHLYVQVYSLTRLRIAAAIWMLLVSIGMALILWRIYAGKSNAWLLNANFVTLLAVLYICCFVNFDRTISWYNVRNCREISGDGVLLDVKYLEELGVESVPALLWFQKNTEASQKAADAYLAVGRLVHRLTRDSNNWKGWTIRHHFLIKEIS
jgi:hypothetical protein